MRSWLPQRMITVPDNGILWPGGRIQRLFPHAGADVPAPKFRVDAGNVAYHAAVTSVRCVVRGRPRMAATRSGPHQSHEHHAPTLHTLRPHKPIHTGQQNGHRVCKVRSGAPGRSRARDICPVLPPAHESGRRQAKRHCAIATQTAIKTAARSRKPDIRDSRQSASPDAQTRHPGQRGGR